MRLRNSRNCKQSAKLFSPYLTAADDGFSGVNFNRPGFQSLIKEVEAGNVGTLIVKDMLKKLPETTSPKISAKSKSPER